MTRKYVTYKVQKRVKRDPEWPKYRFVAGEIQRLRSEDSVPEILYTDEHTKEWRELRH
jgi:hypothetical protein